MKRITTLFLGLSLLVAVPGCGSQDADTAGPELTTESAETTTDEGATDESSTTEESTEAAPTE